MTQKSPYNELVATVGRPRLVALLLALSMLTMPVTYRAGTDVAHAHSFFHFLSDAAHGSMDHHRRGAEEAGGNHRGHAALEPPSVLTSAPAGTPALEPFIGALERATAVALALLFAVTLFGGGKALPLDAAAMLLGIGHRPSVPPPRRAPTLP